MRFMIFMIPAVYQPGRKIDPNFAPQADALEKMGRFNAELEKAGALIEVDGLHPLSKGARVAFSGGKVQVTDGAQAEAREVVGGYWLIEAKSKEDAVNWMKRCPAEDGDIIEIRQIYELSDMPADVQKAARRSGG